MLSILFSTTFLLSLAILGLRLGLYKDGAFTIPISTAASSTLTLSGSFLKNVLDAFLIPNTLSENATVFK